MQAGLPFNPVGPLQGEWEGRVVLQAPLLEFCYQTSHPPLLGRGAGPLPVNKVTVLARTLQSRLLPSPWHEQATPAAATGFRLSGKERKA